jgi:hypothetical protein
MRCPARRAMKTIVLGAALLLGACAGGRCEGLPHHRIRS